MEYEEIESGFSDSNSDTTIDYSDNENSDKEYSDMENNDKVYSDSTMVEREDM